MKKQMKTRNILSMAALTAALSAALIASPASAGENDTYKSIHNGYLSEYAIQPGEVRGASNETFDAVSADNDTFVSIHNGWLSELESIDTSEVVAMFDVRDSAAYEGAQRKEWLGLYGYRQ